MAVCPHLWGRHSLFRKSPHSGWKQVKAKCFLALWKVEIHQPYSFLHTAAEGWWSVYFQSPYLLGWDDLASLPVLWQGAVSLPLHRANFGEPCWKPLVWHLSQSRASLQCVLPRKTVSSKQSSGNEKVIGEHDASGSSAYLFSLPFMIKHFLGVLSDTKSWITGLKATLEFMAIFFVSQGNQLRQNKIIHPTPHSWWCDKLRLELRASSHAGPLFSLIFTMPWY